MARRTCVVVAACVGACALLFGGCTTTERVGDEEAAESTTTTAAPVATTTTLQAFDVEAQDCESSAAREGTDVLIDQFVAVAGITEDGEADEGCARYVDETDTVAVEVPESWTNVTPAESAEGIASLQVRRSSSGNPNDPVIGVAARETDTTPDLDALLLQGGTAVVQQECVPQPTGDYADGVFTGRVKTYIDCAGDEPLAWIIVAATPNDGAPRTVSLFGQAATLADVEAIAQALNSFALVG